MKALAQAWKRSNSLEGLRNGQIIVSTKFTPEKAIAFCAALSETCNVGKACAAVGISRRTAYYWREDAADFAEAWDHAMKIGLSALEDEAHRRAFEGVDKPLTHQGQFTYLRDFEAIDPETGERYPPHMAPVLKDEKGAPRVATMKEYSDTLAIFLLKAHAPDKYRDNSKVELAGSLALNQMTDDEIRAEIAALAAGGLLRSPDDVSDLV